MVGLEAVRGVKTINEIAQDYGVHPVQVSQWKREIQDQAKTMSECKRGPSAFPYLHNASHPSHAAVAWSV